MPMIREMTAQDAPFVASLSGQLGYPVTAAEIEKRLAFLTERPGNGLFVAVEGGVVTGWVHVYGVHLLESPVPFAEIGGLVVEDRSRRQGVGKALMTEAEAWAREHGYGEVRLRSGMHRTEAHQFYRRIGYSHTKTSHLFRKTLESTP